MGAEGQKKWVIYHPEDSADLPLEELEGNENVSRVDFVLNKGEVLYVPHLSPHHVENKCVTLAISGNFFDQTNLDKALEEFKIHCPAIHRAMDEIEWPEITDDITDHEEYVGLFEEHEELQHREPYRIDI